MVPTVKTLTKYDIPEPQTVRGLMEGSIDPESFASVQRWVSECYNLPNRVELALCAINEVVNGFGVEGIPDEDYSKPGVSYVNRGDTYTPTVIYNGSGYWNSKKTGSWRIQWMIGDIASVIENLDNA